MNRQERCGHPAQQHGRRIPPFNFERPFLIRISRVSAFFPDVIQQIHSLRASGVMSSHTARAFGFDASAFRKSAGAALCAGPFVAMLSFYTGCWDDVGTFMQSMVGSVKKEGETIC
jgi:hypothetical protein